MLHEFVTANRTEILLRTRKRARDRSWPSVVPTELEEGVPLFLTQLVETLRSETTTAPFSGTGIDRGAGRYGAEMLRAGITVNHVVHDYGDICQVVTELAMEQKAPITVEEFHILNRSLDTAIADAVTEFARLTAETRTSEEIERLGRAAHELRDILNTSLLAYHSLRGGAVAINGSTGELLGRSLLTLRDLIDRTLSEVRLAANTHRRERLTAVAFLDDIALVGRLHSEHHKVQFIVDPVEPTLAFWADPQLLASAVMNLLHNAFKNTPPGGQVIVRALPSEQRVLIEIEDRCGGIPDSKGNLFQPFGERSGSDRSGLGLGLSIARNAVRAHGGDILIRNMPGKGCVFVVAVPLAGTEGAAPEIPAVGISSPTLERLQE